MNFKPWEEVKYITNLTKDEIINRINGVVEPKGLFGIHFLKKYSYGKPFAGEIYENGFKITRITFYKNLFKPIIAGNIIEDKEQNIINVKIRCHYFIVGFMAIWFGLLLLSIISNITKAIFGINNSIEIISSLIGALIFLLLGYLILILPFKYESMKAKKMLNELFCENKNI
jgi:hypothetical protein